MQNSGTRGDTWIEPTPVPLQNRHRPTISRSLNSDISPTFSISIKVPVNGVEEASGVDQMVV